jgi:hypothetical protein
MNKAKSDDQKEQAPQQRRPGGKDRSRGTASRSEKSSESSKRERSA